MDSVKKVMKEKLDLTEEDVIEYVKKNWPRVMVSVAALLIQFVWTMIMARSVDWQKRIFPSKVYYLLKWLLYMVVFEAIRWSDVFIKKYALKKPKHDATGHASRQSLSEPR